MDLAIYRDALIRKRQELLGGTAAKPLQWLKQWDVARAIRESGGWLVVVTTEGIRLEG